MSKGLFQFDEYVLDAERLRLSRDGEVIPTHPKAAETLLALLEQHGEVVSKEELMNRLWPDTFVEEANLKQNIYILRRALGDDKGEPRYIATVPKRGYRFLAKVRKFEADATTPNGTTIQPAHVAVVPAIKGQRRWWWVAAVLVVIAVIVSALSFSRGKPVLTDKDTILLTDWENKTGDAIFDGTLKQGLAVQLQQSPFLNLFPDAQARSTLRLMGRAPEEKITSDIGREICQRQGLKALILGTIAPLGGHYVITLEAINSQSGAVVAREQIEAESKEQVLTALSTVTSKLREQLGESLASIRQFDKPLPEVTTSSLEALKAYALASELSAKGKRLEAIPIYKRALELDPNFATAYTALATVMMGAGQAALGHEYAAKAFALKERASSYEQFRISANYYLAIQGDLGKALEWHEVWRQTFPRDIRPLMNMSVIYRLSGQFEKALSAADESLKPNPKNGGLEANRAQALLKLGRFAEAQESLRKVIEQKFDPTFVHEQIFQLAVIAGDLAAQQQQLAWAKGKPDEHEAAIWQAEAAAFAGQRRRAQELMERAAEVAGPGKHDEDLVGHLAKGALWNAALGQCAQARVASQQSLNGVGLAVQGRMALALALCGQATQTQTLIAEISKRFPQETHANGIWLPVTRAALALRNSDAQSALELLRPALRYEAAAEFWPQYLRGQAYLQLKQGHEAAAEFQKILDHRGEAPLSVLYPLAHLGLARTAALSGDSIKARKLYAEFLALWKGADADLPMLIAAKKESDNLR